MNKYVVVKVLLILGSLGVGSLKAMDTGYPIKLVFGEWQNNTADTLEIYHFNIMRNEILIGTIAPSGKIIHLNVAVPFSGKDTFIIRKSHDRNKALWLFVTYNARQNDFIVAPTVWTENPRAKNELTTVARNFDRMNQPAPQGLVVILNGTVSANLDTLHLEIDSIINDKKKLI